MRENLIRELHRGNKRPRLAPPRPCAFCGLVKVVAAADVPDGAVFCRRCDQALDSFMDAAEADLVLPADPPGVESDKKLCATLYQSIRQTREVAPEPGYSEDFEGGRR